MHLVALEPRCYLAGDDVVDTAHPRVRALAGELTVAGEDGTAFARRAFEYVRDEIAHSFDVSDPRVTVRASEVAEHRVGLCYAKSHLLAALLRSRGVPAGLCYQRLTDGEGHVVHGLVAGWLDGQWHRLDARGNKPGVDARFDLTRERLAFAVDPAQGEVDYPEVHVRPLPEVLAPLRAADDVLRAPLLTAL